MSHCLGECSHVTILTPPNIIVPQVTLCTTVSLCPPLIKITLKIILHNNHKYRIRPHSSKRYNRKHTNKQPYKGKTLFVQICRHPLRHLCQILSRYPYVPPKTANLPESRRLFRLILTLSLLKGCPENRVQSTPACVKVASNF